MAASPTLRFRYRRFSRNELGRVHHLAQAFTASEPVNPVTIRDDVHPDFLRRGIATALLADVRGRHPQRHVVHDGLTREGEQWWATFGAPDDDWLD